MMSVCISSGIYLHFTSLYAVLVCTVKMKCILLLFTYVIYVEEDNVESTVWSQKDSARLITASSRRRDNHS